MIRTAALSLIVLVGCAAKDDVADVDCSQFEGRYLPLRSGMQWSYNVRDVVTDRTTQKTQTVFAVEDVPGKPGVRANRLVTTKPNGEVVSWQEDTGTAVIRHREHDLSGLLHTEELYEPFRMRLDESQAHTITGATWSQSYTENVRDQSGVQTMASKEETWTVVAVDEVVETPAGDFCAMRVRRSSTIGGTAGSTKTYWYVRGIGKVKEFAKDQVEELASFVVAP